MQRRSILKATAGVAATLAAPRVFAQMWPSGPIRIVVGFPPGGGADALAPSLLIDNPNESAKTVKDIVALCKAKPGQVSFGSADAGSAQHLALEMFKLRAQVNAIHVP